jgi:hypothetical protein
VTHQGDVSDFLGNHATSLWKTPILTLVVDDVPGVVLLSRR